MRHVPVRPLRPTVFGKTVPALESNSLFGRIWDLKERSRRGQSRSAPSHTHSRGRRWGSGGGGGGGGGALELSCSHAGLVRRSTAGRLDNAEAQIKLLERERAEAALANSSLLEEIEELRCGTRVTAHGTAAISAAIVAAFAAVVDDEDDVIDLLLIFVVVAAALAKAPDVLCGVKLRSCPSHV